MISKIMVKQSNQKWKTSSYVLGIKISLMRLNNNYFIKEISEIFD